jgi:hypothetical protein
MTVELAGTSDELRAVLKRFIRQVVRRFAELQGRPVTSDELRAVLKRFKRQVVRRVAELQGRPVTTAILDRVEADTDLATLYLEDSSAQEKSPDLRSQAIFIWSVGAAWAKRRWIEWRSFAGCRR